MRRAAWWSGKMLETISNQFDDISTNGWNMALGQMKWNEKSGSTCAAINQTHVQIIRFSRANRSTTSQTSTVILGFESVCKRRDRKKLARWEKTRKDSHVLEYFSSAKWLRKIFRTEWERASALRSIWASASVLIRNYRIHHTHTYTKILQSHIYNYIWRESSFFFVCERQWAWASTSGCATRVSYHFSIIVWFGVSHLLSTDPSVKRKRFTLFQTTGTCFRIFFLALQAPNLQRYHSFLFVRRWNF